MGSGEETKTETSAEALTTPSVYPEWPPMAAYYGGAAAAGTPPAFFPYMWGGQHMMPPYGTPVAYHRIYPTAMYPHPAVAPGTVVTAPSEAEEKSDVEGHNEIKRSKNNSGDATRAPSKSANGVKETCTSGNEDASHSDGNRTDGSCNSGDGAQNNQNASTNGKRNFEKINGDGKAVIPAPAPSFNIGMDIWKGAHPGSMPSKERSNAVNMAQPVGLLSHNGVVGGNQCVLDERELKRQKRKESNRESARRSRQRKQQECEELEKKVDELTAENDKIRTYISELKRKCKLIELENASMQKEFGEIGEPELLSAIEGNSTNLSNSNQAT